MVKRKVNLVRSTLLIALPLVASLIAVCLHTSIAQQPQFQQPGAFQREGGQRPQFGREGFQPMMMFRAQLPVAIYANEKYVYVVRGNVLYQFDAETLQLKNRVILEAIVPPGAPGQFAPPPPKPAPQQ